MRTYRNHSTEESNPSCPSKVCYRYTIGYVGSFDYLYMADKRLRQIVINSAAGPVSLPLPLVSAVADTLLPGYNWLLLFSGVVGQPLQTRLQLVQTAASKAPPHDYLHRLQWLAFVGYHPSPVARRASLLLWLRPWERTGYRASTVWRRKVSSNGYRSISIARWLHCVPLGSSSSLAFVYPHACGGGAQIV